MNNRARKREDRRCPAGRGNFYAGPVLGVFSGVLGVASLVALPVLAAPEGAVRKKPAVKATRATPAVRTQASAKVAAKPLPRYLPMEDINTLRVLRGEGPPPILQPYFNGRSLNGDHQNLMTGSPTLMKIAARQAEKAQRAYGERYAQVFPQPPLLPLPPMEGVVETRRSAQVFPDPAVGAGAPGGLAPAVVPPVAAPPIVPRWVRYPLEFQLCGIGLGTRAVDKDELNRIDRYGLFAIHGNPTAVVVPTVVTIAPATAGGAEGGPPGAGAGGGRGGAPADAGGAPGVAQAAGSVTVLQQPPEYGDLFPAAQGGELPDWAAAVTVDLDNNHVEWLYRRETYTMGFVVDRLGFVDAIVVAGVTSPIARTQLEDPVHTVRLGDDLRKVLFRYGYPDTIETYLINAIASGGVATAAAAGGAPGAEGGAPPGGAPPGAGGAPGAEGAGGAAADAGNTAFRTFEVRYEQSYNVVFTIRNNRVVRIYIFGDPDFFTEARRQQLRIRY